LYEKTTLDNGLRIVSVTMPNIRSVSVSIYTGTGSRYEAAKVSGISHFIEHLMFRGTPKRPTSQDIAEAIEGIGGVLNAATDREVTFYWAKVTKEHFPLALDVLADMVRNAKFDPKDIEKERQVIIEEINACLDSPSGRVEMLMDELLWPGHPLGRDIAGTRETVSAITRQDMLDFVNLHYVPENTVVAVAGNVTHDEAVAAVRTCMGTWRAPHTHLGFTPFVPPPAGTRVSIENRKIEEAHISMGMTGLSLFDPKRFRFDLMNTVLGNGMSSRLFREVRDKLGLVYSIGSYGEHLLDSGSFVISAGVEPKNLKAVIEATLEQLTLLKEPLPEWELKKAKEITKGHLVLRMEDSRSTAGWVGGQEILKGKILTVDEVVSIIDAITAEQIQSIAKEVLIGDKLRLAVVGPVKADEPLEKLLKI
jgi:predicted Zn-dependent peptidase